MTITLAAAADARLYARARHEAEPTGRYFTRTTRPITAQEQRHNVELLQQAVYPHQARQGAEPTAIRALTIRPPWSDLIALADEQVAKRVENRSWLTSWRGTLLIHAGLTLDRQALTLEAVQSALADTYTPRHGHVVAVAELTDIHGDDGPCTPWSAPGAFHWTLRNVHVLHQPVKATGTQGLWKPSRTLLDAITASNPALTTRLAEAGRR